MVTVSPTTGHVYAARGAACHRAARPEREFHMRHILYPISADCECDAAYATCYIGSGHRPRAEQAQGVPAGEWSARSPNDFWAFSPSVGAPGPEAPRRPDGASAACGEGSTCRGGGAEGGRIERPVFLGRGDRLAGRSPQSNRLGD